MKNLSLNIKMIMIFTFFGFGIITVSAIGIYNLNSLNNSIQDVVDVKVPLMSLAFDVQGDFRFAALSHMQFLAENNPPDIDRRGKEIQEQHQANLKNFETAFEKATEKGLPFWKIAHAEYLKWWEIAERARQAKFAGEIDKAYLITRDLREHRELADDNLENLVEMNRKLMIQADTDTTVLYEFSRNMISLVSLIAIFVASALAFIVLRTTSAAIQRVISELNEGSAQVSSASQQIASSSEQLSQAATEQAASLEETAASVEEMNSMITKNSENAKSASETSAKSQHMVVQGQDVIKKMIVSMEAINRSSEGMSETVAVIEQIDKETKVINEIVNKTELLSFNASVEAARAGEHGKGFAVVAEEVGNLARMSGVAAEKIATLLEESKRKVNQMVLETKANVSEGNKITMDCGVVFDKIVIDVNSVAGMSTEIASASQEQARGVVEITKAMNQLDQMTQQNAATSEECASAAEELSAQANVLKSSVQQLMSAINGGGKGQPESSHPHPTPRHVEPKHHSNIVAMKPAKRPSAQQPSKEVVFKKASGSEMPNYNSDGFSDV